MPSIETRCREEKEKNNSEFKSDKQQALQGTTSFSSLSLENVPLASVWRGV